MPAAFMLQQHVQTFRDFPPRQAPPDFDPKELFESVLKAAAAGTGNA
jgi:arylsulfatase